MSEAGETEEEIWQRIEGQPCIGNHCYHVQDDPQCKWDRGPKRQIGLCCRCGAKEYNRRSLFAKIKEWL